MAAFKADPLGKRAWLTGMGATTEARRRLPAAHRTFVARRLIWAARHSYAWVFLDCCQTGLTGTSTMQAFTATAHASGDKVCIRIGDERGGRSTEISPERAVEPVKELVDAVCAARAARELVGSPHRRHRPPGV